MGGGGKRPPGKFPATLVGVVGNLVIFEASPEDSAYLKGEAGPVVLDIHFADGEHSVGVDSPEPQPGS